MNKSRASRIVKFCAMAFAIISINTNAAIINFNGQLDIIDVDDGGVYSGATTSTNFSGNIDDGTANGSISDGTTVTPFGCCIAAGGFSITNNELLNADDAALLNSITGTSTFSAGDMIDIVDADGFFPKIDILTGSSNDAVVMTRSGTCPSYNTPYDPAVVPGSAGKLINIAGKVLTIHSFDEFKTTNDVRMARASECQ